VDLIRSRYDGSRSDGCNSAARAAAIPIPALWGVYSRIPDGPGPGGHLVVAAALLVLAS